MHHLRWPVLILVAAAGVGCDSSSNSCTTTVHSKFDIARPDAPNFEFQAERCQGDADACGELCADAAAVHGIANTLDTCTVSFDADVSVHFDVTYETFNENNGCAVPGGGFNAGGGQP